MRDQVKVAGVLGLGAVLTLLVGRTRRRLIERRGRRESEWLAARVRTKVERVIARPHGLEVTAEDGRVLLSGPILAGELDPLLSTVWRVPGVGQVDARVELYDSPAEVPAGDSQQPRPAQVPLPGRGGPAFRFVAVLSAAGVAGYGLHRLRQRPPEPEPEPTVR